MTQEETEMQDLYNILKAVLHNDNTVRQKAEEKLKGYLVVPQKLLLYLVKIMQSAPEDYIRKLSSVLFKHYIALEEASTLWKNIDPAQQNIIKTELLNALRKELNPKVSRQICQAIAELGGLIFSYNQAWAELEELIMTYVKSNDIMIESALRILDTLFALNPERYLQNVPIVCGIFDTAFSKTSTNVLLSAAKAMCTLIGGIDTSDTKPFQKYSANVINTIMVLGNEGNEDNLHELLSSISEMSEGEPTFFRKTYPQLNEVLLKLSSKTDFDNDKLRQMPLEILVTIIERLPVCGRKHKKELWNLCSAAFNIAVSIEDECDETWMKPKEGYNTEEDLNPDDNVNFAVIMYDRLLSCLDDEYIFPVIEKMVEASMSSSDWRYRNAALMIIGQIGEYCESTEKVKNIIPIIASHCSHAHPKVRFAAFYCIGLLSDYMYPEFQEEFSDALLPPMIAGIEDTVPRVSSHACAALTNFLEHVKQETAANLEPTLLPKLLKAIQDGISIVKENAMSCISSIAESAAEDYEKYYDEITPFLFKCLEHFTAKEYNQFRAQTVECITITSAAVGKEKFLKYAPSTIEIMNSFLEADTTKENAQRFYMLSAWQRVCLILEKDFANYLPKVVPGLMRIAGSMPGMGLASSLKTGSLESILKELSGEKDNKLELTTSEIEEKQLSLQMLDVFAVQLEEKYAPYVEETTRIVEQVLTFGPNSELRKQGAGLLPKLLNCLKKASIPLENLTIVCGKYIAALISAHDKELNAEVKSAQVLALKDVYENMGHFMNSSDTKTVIEKILSYFKDSNDRRNQLKSHQDSSKDEDEEKDDEDDEQGDSAEKIEAEEDYQKNITYFLGAVVNTHKQEALPSVSVIISNVVQPSLMGGVNDQRCALFIVDDLVEYLGSALLGDTLWKQLAGIILTYATRAEHELRHAALYGIGSLAISGGYVFTDISVQCLTTLASAIEVKKDKEKIEEWTAARENAISSVGKILKYQPKTIPFGEVWAKWLSYLPISEDKAEAKLSHEFVIDTLMSNPEAAIGSNGNLLGEVIRILIAAYTKKLVTKVVRKKLIVALKQLVSNPGVAALLENLKLGKDEKNILEKIVKGE